ncbi:type II toxin-antitoxin system prevent-host-death family antitoxin [Pendulispora rubella]|uniref:Antitoxin n=1 Tax=Pendulispora rubella TaxID=2741070 RepID=A0ABZ2LJ26_9BACT
MKRVTVSVAREQFASLLEEVETGGEVELVRRGRPIAAMVPIEAARRLNAAKGYRAWLAEYADVDLSVLEPDEERSK